MKKLLLLLTIITVSAFAQSNTVKLAWDASTTPNVTYNVYRSKQAGGCPNGSVPTGCTKANTTPVAVLSFDDSVPGTGRWFYVVRAVDADGVESNNSNELSVIIRPNPPTNLRQT